MANIKDFERRKNSSNSTDNTNNSADKSADALAASADSEQTRPRRRPASEGLSTAEVKVVDVESGIQSHSTHIKQDAATSVEASPEEEVVVTSDSISAETQGPKVEIHFTGSELIRAKFPRPFDIVEKVATDWVNNGDFSKIPLGHPLAEYAAQEGLKQAKKLEKQILESPTTEKIATEVLMVGMKAQGKVQGLKSLFDEIKAKVGLKK
jgi:hypothetical protein